MGRAAALADYLREQAKWRGDNADEYDDDRNTRSGLSLLDAALYVERLPDDDARLLRLAAARCFLDIPFSPGEEMGHVVRLWNFHAPTGPAAQFLEDLAIAADRDAAEFQSEAEDNHQ